MQSNEMLSRFFINDTSTASQEWRLKAHAVRAFWDWLASFARMAEKPSDLGDSDDGFVLPPFDIIRHRARDSELDKSFTDMFGAPSMSATSLHEVKRQTREARADAVEAVWRDDPKRSWIFWTDTNYEADAVRTAIPTAIDIRGSMSIDEKEELLDLFSTGAEPYLITKPTLTGFGLDWSHCDRMAFVGRSYSYETFYQAVRRCWRFGQKNTVKVHLIVADGEDTIGRVIDRKESSHFKMKAAMRDAMKRATGKSSIVKAPYLPTHKARLAPWICAA
jgi:superfamily II DNA or RNA helicase